MERILHSSIIIRKQSVTSTLLLLAFTVFCTFVQAQKGTVTTDKDDYWPGELVIITGTGWNNDDSVQLTLMHLDPLPDPYHTHTPWFVKPDADGKIYYEWLVLYQELGTSFELGALGFVRGTPSGDYAVTYFMDASIKKVTVNGSSFCDGQNVTVSYTVSNSGGSFGDNNIFTAQLSDSLGSFSTPVMIGILNSGKSGNINAIIPLGTPDGTHYRIRVISSSPVVTSNPNESDITINVSPAATALVSATPDTICAGTSSNLSATSAGNSIRWYTTGIGGTTLGTSASGANFSVTPASTTTYYAETLNEAGCSSPARTIVTVTVNPIPTIISTTPGSVCGSGTVNLAATSSAGIINWYSAATGGVILGTGINFTTSIITSNKTYYVSATANNCTAGTRTAVIATVNSIPAAPTPRTIIQPTCSLSTGSVILNNLPAAGTWLLTRNPGSITTSGSGTTTTISTPGPGTYTFTVTNAAGCTSASSANVVINKQPPSLGTPVFNLDCSLGSGQAKITVTSPASAGLEFSLDAAAYQSSPVFTRVTNGNHFLAVRNLEGCTTIGSIFAVACGCVNPPAVTLRAAGGSTCGTTPVTVTGNIFGGSATGVTLTEDGSGSVSPASSATSPFAFTYTPAPGDRGRMVIITVTSNNPLGSPCTAAIATYALTVSAILSAPTISTITHLTCTGGLGGVVLTGLPPTGTWTLIRYPGGVISNGTGTSTTVSGLDAGTYTFTIANENGCTSASSGSTVINPPPASPHAPVIGTITHPTCAVSTGSVVLNGLPSTGTWTITQVHGGVIRTGSGTSATISTIPGGTYNYTVTNSSGCISPPSDNVVLNEQPAMPTAPSLWTITPPTCAITTGRVNLMGLPSSGVWTLTRYPGTITTTGTGTVTTISDLPSGIYNYTLTNDEGCISGLSANVIIPEPPISPSIPVVETITQPTFAVPTGSVILSGLPSSGIWIITRLPDKVTTYGTGTSFRVAELKVGIFTFTVTNSSGCISEASTEVIISTPDIPVLTITDPSAVCYPATMDLTAPAIKAGSTPGLTYTYWTDAEGTIEYRTPVIAVAGTYYIKGTNISGYYGIKPVIVIIDEMPVSDAGPDQVLDYQFSTTLDAVLNEGENGVWSLDSCSGEFNDITDPKTVISKLSLGNSDLLWIVTNGVCPADTDKVSITVGDLKIPTLITPNGDAMNEYFEIRGIESLGKSELIIFDRKGIQVFKNSNYDNEWNGVDYNSDPLPGDTYFFILKTGSGKSYSGYIVIRR